MIEVAIYLFPTNIIFLGTIQINFMYHFDRATECPAIWLAMILGMSVRACLDAIHIFWVKQIAFPRARRPHPVHWRPEWNRKAEEGRICSLSAWMPSSWDIVLLLPLDSHSDSDWILHRPFSRVSSFRSWDLSASILMWANFLLSIYLSISWGREREGFLKGKS